MTASCNPTPPLQLSSLQQHKGHYVFKDYQTSTKVLYPKSVNVEVVLSNSAKNVCLSVLSVQSTTLNKGLDEPVEQEAQGIHNSLQ